MRLIDADALMTEFMDSDLDHLQRDDWREVIQIVADAPTVTPEPHWIPCSERLPENEEDVLVMMADGEFMDVGWVNSYGWWHVNSDTEERKDISAWMPLPEPYKGVTE